jgi:hypothetical protein
MNKKRIIKLSAIALIIIALSLGSYLGKKKFDDVLSEKKAFAEKEEKKLAAATDKEVEAKEALTKNQDSLSDLAAELAKNLEAEKKLSLTMVSQLQTFESFLSSLKEFSNEVEANLSILDRISNKQFQEDVKLQAALYKGKNSKIVAEHLQEFHANRVGAILAYMKEKEASNVLDIWAVADTPDVSTFYREVMAAYLDNKRYLLNPKLYDKLKSEEDPIKTDLASQTLK